MFVGGDRLDRRPRWLAEGLATYLCHRAIESLSPKLHPWVAFHVIEEATAHQADAAVDAAPVFQATHPSIMYSKPAALLRHLSTVVGERPVLGGVRRWLQGHRFTEATTADLVQSLADATGLDLDTWADEWLLTAGVNTLELRVDASPSGAVASARIVQHADPASGVLRTHHTGVEIYDVSPTGKVVRRDRFGFVVAGEDTEVPELAGQAMPRIAVLNAPPTTYARVRLDDRSREALREHLGELPPATRAVCWVAAKGMVDDGLMPNEELVNWIARHGSAEPDSVVADLLTARRMRVGLSPGWEAWRATTGAPTRFPA